MKKKYIISIIFVIFITLFIIIRLNLPEPPRNTIRGTYQSNSYEDENLLVQLSFETDDHSFVQYHEGKLVDEETFKEVDNKIYLLKSDLQDTHIILQDDNSFYYYDTVLSTPQIINMDLTLTAPLYIDQTNF